MAEAIIQTIPLGFPWKTNDPFLFCVHHVDHYPAGNDHLGPAASLAGRNIGQDFNPAAPWRMYHGENVPGFPAHPHRGFETVTIATRGLIDHSDSLGAAGRFGNGDVQWMTAGKGVQHCEMFPLLRKDKDNPLELFQIWLNLPKAKKLATPHFAMLWNEQVPNHVCRDSNGKETTVKVVAGRIENIQAPAPAPDSWAADADHEVAIWVIKMQAGASFILPLASATVNRSLYFYEGNSIRVAEKNITGHQGIELRANVETKLENGDTESSLLLLQGKPISEPIAQYGPFVMNTHAEIQKAMQDYQATQFGGWPWPTYEHVHPRDKGRFAKYPDGRVEERI